jgi:hypothetical protein
MGDLNLTVTPAKAGVPAGVGAEAAAMLFKPVGAHLLWGPSLRWDDVQRGGS